MTKSEDLVNVSTKKGDKGTSSLSDDQKLPKYNVRFEVLGTLDELNSWLGVVVAKMALTFSKQKKFILLTQQVIYQISAIIAGSDGVRIDQDFLSDLESRSNSMQHKLQRDWTKHFLKPGGTELAAWLDVSRSVCRRLERRLVLLSREQSISADVLKIVNRLSDYLYVLRCFVNYSLQHNEEVLVGNKSLK